MSDKISIIIPAYNCEETITDSINSIIGQNYENFELIIIDDGSSDKTLEKCNSINDSRIKIFSKPNGRVVDTYIYGINKASGDYIMFCDSDDTYRPNILLKVLNTIKSSNADFVCFGYDIFSTKKTPIKSLTNGLESKTFNLSEIQTLIYPSFIFNTSIKKCYYSLLVFRWCKIYKIETIRKFINDLDPNCYQMEDNIFTTLCVLNSKKITICNESIYNYVTNTNTISKGFNWKLIDEYEYSFSYLKKVVSSYNIPNIEEQLKYMRFDFYRVIFRRAAKVITYKEIKTLLKQIRKLKITTGLQLSKIIALKNKVFYILEKLRFDYLCYLVFKKF